MVGPYWLQWSALAAVVATVATIGSARSSQASGPSPSTLAFLAAAGRRRLLLLGLSALMGVYVLSIGGDFMHGRMWIPSWIFMVGALAGVGSDVASALYRRRPIAHPELVIIAVAVTIAAVHLPLESEQRRDLVAGGDGIIEGIADEAAFYEIQNPNLHDFGADNESFLFVGGRVSAGLATRLGDEIGVAVGAIGQFAYGGQLDGGDVFVFDRGGLTRVDGARFEPVEDGRVGHAKDAPPQAFLLHPRVDLHLLSAGEVLPNEFVVDLDGVPFQIINLELVDDLVASGILPQSDRGRIERAITERLDGPTIDANFLTYLVERAPGDAPYRDRLDELAALEQDSEWRRWLRSTEATRAVLSNDGCPDRSWWGCLDLAIERHGAVELPRGESTDPRPAPATDG